MPVPSLVAAALGAMTVLASVATPGWSAADPLAAYQDRARVLLVAAPSSDDPMLREQRAVFAAMGEGARTRDLVLVEAVGRTEFADRLRAAFDIDPQSFAAVLIGKDGGAKLRSAAVLGPDRLYPTIDAMPMRRDEMRRRTP